MYGTHTILQGDVTEQLRTLADESVQCVVRQVDNEANQREWGTAAGRNARTVWTITTQPYPDAHFATFPEELPRRCIAAGTSESDTVLDPFAGSGTTLLVACQMGRNAVGIELNEEYTKLAEDRIGRGLRPSAHVGNDGKADAPLFSTEGNS